MRLLELLLGFLRLRVDDPAPDADPTPDPAPDPAPDPTDDLDVDPDPAPEPDTKSPEAEAALASLRAAEERAARAEREAAELRTRHHQPQVDEITRQEEERLKDPKATDLEKWQIQANRELRRGRSEAQFALAQAHDVADKTAFSRIANTNAALFKRYEERVEKVLADMRAKGYNAPREQIMDNLIGKDMRDGKFAKKAAPKKEDDTGKQPVNRGKLPGARSDVSGKNAMSEHEKRRQRLENVQI
jgi:hypothetical protein